MLLEFLNSQGNSPFIDKMADLFKSCSSIFNDKIADFFNPLQYEKPQDYSKTMGRAF